LKDILRYLVNWVSQLIYQTLFFLKSSFEGGYYRDNWTRKPKLIGLPLLLNTIPSITGIDSGRNNRGTIENTNNILLFGGGKKK
jgi:hypothetical protein